MTCSQNLQTISQGYSCCHLTLLIWALYLTFPSLCVPFRFNFLFSRPRSFCFLCSYFLKLNYSQSNGIHNITYPRLYWIFLPFERKKSTWCRIQQDLKYFTAREYMWLNRFIVEWTLHTHTHRHTHIYKHEQQQQQKNLQKKMKTEWKRKSATHKALPSRECMRACERKRRKSSMPIPNVVTSWTFRHLQ